MYLVSVIIPCFNSAKTINETVLSIVNQVDSSVEIILIDDYSTDGTFKILKELQSAHSDLSITVLKNKNKGVSSARNLGIAVSKGTFLTFVDSDDQLKYGFFETFQQLSVKESVDVFYFRHSLLTQEGVVSEKSTIPSNSTYTGLEFARYHSEGRVTNSVCDKVFRRSLIVDLRILFPDGISVAEDAAFTSISLSKSRFVYSHSGNFYVYNITNTGTMRNGLGVDKFLYAMKAAEYVKSNLTASQQNILPLLIINLAMPYIVHTNERELIRCKEFGKLVSAINSVRLSRHLLLRFIVVIFSFKVLDAKLALRFVKMIYKFKSFSSSFFWGGVKL